jgi:NADH-quinone oxidoreductase subunit G
VCPVGALTSRDFRFKARVWFLRAAKGVCNGCATGCNDYLDFDPRHNRVYRIRPRDNEAVNKFWMCDDGMLTYHALSANRITTGSVRNGDTKALAPSDALTMAAGALGRVNGAKVAVVLSAQYPSEDNAALASFARDVLGSDKFYLGALGGWQGDDILRNPDNNPNRAGALAAAIGGHGGKAGTLEDLLKDAGTGAIEGLIALGGPTAEDAAKLAPLRSLKANVVMAWSTTPLTEVAQLIVPVTSYAEMEGTFVNAKGMAQRFMRALTAADGVRPAWKTLHELSAAMGKPLSLPEPALPATASEAHPEAHA